MIRIALNFRSAPVLNGNQDATGVRAIMWAGGMNNFLHGLMIIRFRRALLHRATREAPTTILMATSVPTIVILSSEARRNLSCRMQENLASPQRQSSERK